MEYKQHYDFKAELVDGFKIVDLAQLYQNSFDEATSPHRLKFYQIHWFKKGTAKHWVDFRDLEITPNSLVLLHKNSVQKFNKNGYPRGKSILFTEDFFCKTKADKEYLKSSVLFNDLMPISKFEINSESLNLQKILNQIILEFEQPKDMYQADILRNHLRNFLLHAERERKHQGLVEIKKDVHFNLVMDFKFLLVQNFKTNKNVSFYCDCLKVSPKKLNASTLKVLGVSPKSIIIEKVLLEAKRTLISTEKTTKEITSLLGFEESTNFIKFFKKQTNQTPLEFRDSFKME